MNRQTNCNRSIAVIFKGSDPILARLKSLLDKNGGKDVPYKLQLDYDHNGCLFVKANLPEISINTFINNLSSYLKQPDLHEEDNLDILIIDQERSECVINQNDIDLCMGWRVRIVSSKEKAKPCRPQKTILLKKDANAFGTGLHPSTRLTCETLLYLHNCGKLKEANVLDVGTGSGILSIFLAKMGAKKIIGTDIDQEIINVAQENACLNQVESKVSFTTKPLSKLQLTGVNGIVANLTPSVLFDLLDTMVSILNSEGWLILSGHSPRIRDEICKRLRKHRLNMVKHLSSQGWSAEIFFRS